MLAAFWGTQGRKAPKRVAFLMRVVGADLIQRIREAIPDVWHGPLAAVAGHLQASLIALQSWRQPLPARTPGSAGFCHSSLRHLDFWFLSFGWGIPEHRTQHGMCLSFSVQSASGCIGNLVHKPLLV